jgi:hypothetical protein
MEVDARAGGDKKGNHLLTAWMEFFAKRCGMGCDEGENAPMDAPE